MAIDKNKDFATTGTESYKLKGQDKSDKVVLTIQEEAPEAVKIEDIQFKGELTGNPIIDGFTKLNRYFISKSSIKVKDKATFFHLLGVMINAGIPMVKALRSLVAQTDKSPKLQMVIDAVADAIEAGSTLSGAFAKSPEIFSEQEIGMVESGEASGQLARVLDNLAKDTEKAYEIKAKVKSAMTYPIVIICLLFLVVAAMMIYVIPSLKSLFENSDEELPTITKIVVATSDFMVENTLFIVGGIATLILVFLIGKRTQAGRYMFDKFKITVPLFGSLFKKSYLSRFARSLSNLLDSNISIVRAVEITSISVGNEVYKRRLLMSMEDIKQGIPLGESLSESDLFPPMMVNMIEVGEQTAQLDEISGKVAKFYETEVDTAVAGISKIIEPVILIFIGATVGTVVAAIMLPIMQLSNVAGAM